MRRGAKPAKGKVEAKLPDARKSRTKEGSRDRQPAKRLAEALEQQAATSEILRVISSSLADAQPVFDAIAVNALRLCDAEGVVVARYDGKLLHVAAHHNVNRETVDRLERQYPQAPDRHIPLGRAVLDGAVVHVPDLQAAVEFSGSVARQLGAGSHVAIPLLHQGRAVGGIGISRRRRGPFSDRQITLLQTFADQAVIAIENVRLFTETEEALERQTATSEILRVISSSPTDIQPVLETIVEHAGRVCGAFDAIVFLVEGARLVRTAHRGPVPITEGSLSLPIERDSASGLAVLECRTVYVEDILASREFPRGRAIAKRSGFRTAVSVPLVKEGAAIGTLVVRRTEMQAFTTEQIALLETFADQAVIAIENVRLFRELQERNHDLTEALDRQTATSEILRVISSSPTDAQPVFNAIARNAVMLCGGIGAVVLRFDGEVLHVAGHHNVSPIGVERLEQRYPRRPGRDFPPGRAFLDRAVVHVPDLQAATEFAASTARERGAGSQLAVPLLRAQEAIGVIGLARDVVGPFSPEQIEVLQTFADQAVIAIENVRLFTELGKRNRELTEALEQQTATSDILRVISRSQTNVQPVFDAIVASAVRLLGAYTGALTQIAGDQIELAALTSTDDAGDAATRARFPQSLQSEGSNAQAIRDRAPINIADAQTDPRTPEAGRATARARGYRSQVVVPLLRHDEAVGTIAVSRREPGGFTDDEIALLKTFADQAVIAIENARLLTELQARTQELSRSVEQLTALGEVGRAVGSSLDLETVLTTIVSRAVELSGLDGGVVFEYDEVAEEFVQRAQTETGDALAEVRRTNRIRKGEGVLGRTAITLESVQVPDITMPGAYAGRLRENLIESGIRAILAVPMVYEGRLIGCLGVTRNHPGDFPSDTIELLGTFATQSALAIQNARLFREIEDKSRQLEVASQHKSEFLANMSHELRTPLNAIIGFSEVLTERMFGDLNEKQEEYLKDIYASGTHLLSLINDILDLSKIEAGRMELELTDFDLPQAIDNALTLVRERSGRRGITLDHSVDERLGEIRGDERKVKQVLLNLLSNALKFTPEGGRVEVRAGMVDGMAQISVTDTGVGIAPEDQEAVFEEFRQVGTSAAKQEGTGLGLTLCRKFVELHGGKIWVQSEVGRGSTFTFTIPVRPGE